jgi:hypothetical protein
MDIELKNVNRPGSPLPYETLLKDVIKNRKYNDKGRLISRPVKKVVKLLPAPMKKKGIFARLFKKEVK